MLEDIAGDNPDLASVIEERLGAPGQEGFVGRRQIGGAPRQQSIGKLPECGGDPGVGGGGGYSAGEWRSSGQCGYRGIVGSWDHYRAGQ